MGATPPAATASSPKSSAPTSSTSLPSPQLLSAVADAAVTGEVRPSVPDAADADSASSPTRSLCYSPPSSAEPLTRTRLPAAAAPSQAPLAYAAWHADEQKRSVRTPRRHARLEPGVEVLPARCVRALPHHRGAASTGRLWHNGCAAGALAAPGAAAGVHCAKAVDASTWRRVRGRKRNTSPNHMQNC